MLGNFSDVQLMSTSSMAKRKSCPFPAPLWQSDLQLFTNLLSDVFTFCSVQKHEIQFKNGHWNAAHVFYMQNDYWAVLGCCSQRREQRWTTSSAWESLLKTEAGRRAFPTSRSMWSNRNTKQGNLKRRWCYFIYSITVLIYPFDKCLNVNVPKFKCERGKFNNLQVRFECWKWKDNLLGILLPCPLVLIYNTVLFHSNSITKQTRHHFLLGSASTLVTLQRSFVLHFPTTQERHSEYNLRRFTAAQLPM